MKITDIFLLEMAIKIAEIESDSRRLGIQIRTNNVEGTRVGQGEHQPPHIHVVHYKSGLDIPISLLNNEIPKNHKTKGQLSKRELKDINWFLEYYGRPELAEIFNKAMLGYDPEPLFNDLAIRKNREHQNNQV